MYKNIYNFSILIYKRFFNKNSLLLKNQIKKKNIILDQVEIIFKLPSILENKSRFILMLILLEKYLNNRVVFLLDTHTFSKSRIIKIGCILHIKKELAINYLFLCNIHSIPKFYENWIIFEILKSNYSFYEMNKILFNTIFNIDKDINLFYDYLSDFNYVFNINFRTIFNNSLFNKLLLNCYGFYSFNNIQIQYINLIENSWLNVLLEETETEEEDFLLSEINDIENIEKYYNLINYNIWQEENELDFDILFLILYDELLEFYI